MQGRWPKQTVQALISALRSGRVTIPVSSFSLARAVGGLPESLTSALVRWFAAGVSVDAVIEMLDAIEQQTALAAGASIELVWTGPEAADRRVAGLKRKAGAIASGEASPPGRPGSACPRRSDHRLGGAWLGIR